MPLQHSQTITPPPTSQAYDFGRRFEVRGDRMFVCCHAEEPHGAVHAYTKDKYGMWQWNGRMVPAEPGVQSGWYSLRYGYSADVPPSGRPLAVGTVCSDEHAPDNADELTRLLWNSGRVEVEGFPPILHPVRENSQGRQFGYDVAWVEDRGRQILVVGTLGYGVHAYQIGGNSVSYLQPLNPRHDVYPGRRVRSFGRHVAIASDYTVTLFEMQSRYFSRVCDWPSSTKWPTFCIGVAGVLIENTLMPIVGGPGRKWGVEDPEDVYYVGSRLICGDIVRRRTNDSRVGTFTVFDGFDDRGIAISDPDDNPDSRFGTCVRLHANQAFASAPSAAVNGISGVGKVHVYNIAESTRLENA